MGLTVACAAPLICGFMVLTAVTVTVVGVAGAVSKPVLLMVPALVVHFTDEL